MRQLIHLLGNTMDRTLSGSSPSLPELPEGLASALKRGDTIQMEGTNVVRVPFGVRRPQRNRPARPDHWATLVLPFQAAGDPTPPPAAA